MPTTTTPVAAAPASPSSASVPTTGTLTPMQIAQVAHAAGLTDEDKLAKAVTVAMAESGGRSGVVNSIGCVGLWQIYIKAHPNYTTAQMKIPAENAKAMMSISSGGSNWKPWTTNSAPITPIAKQVAKAVANGLAGPIGSKVVEAGEDGAQAASDGGGIPGAIDRARETIRLAFVNYIVLLIALVLLILGFVVLVRRQVPGLVADAIPGGGVVKTALKAVT